MALEKSATQPEKPSHRGRKVVPRIHKWQGHADGWQLWHKAELVPTTLSLRIHGEYRAAAL